MTPDNVRTKAVPISAITTANVTDKWLAVTVTSHVDRVHNFVIERDSARPAARLNLHCTTTATAVTAA